MDRGAEYFKLRVVLDDFEAMKVSGEVCIISIHMYIYIYMFILRVDIYTSEYIGIHVYIYTYISTYIDRVRTGAT
jgi:hypothetical protein